MPQLADKIYIDNLSHNIIIDGVEFPWVIEKNSVDIIRRDDTLPSIRLTIFANQSVTVMDAEEVKSYGTQEEQAEVPEAA